MSVRKKQSPEIAQPDQHNGQGIPYVAGGVAAGFPSPAADFMETTIDLNKELCKNPLASFYIKVKGNSMTGAGIGDGDVLVVDRSLEPEEGKIAVCLVAGEFTVKRLQVRPDGIYLMPENPDFQPLKVNEESQFVVWGIVTYVIKSV